MKNFFIRYYVIMTMILFATYNLVLKNIRIEGLLYQLMMILLIILNFILLIQFRKKIQCKNFVIISYFFLCLFSKNILQCFFGISSMILLIAIGFLESHFTKMIALFLTIFGVFLYFPFFFFFILFHSNLATERGMNDIYENTHYYCDNSYEVYVFSKGAMDRSHYNIGKNYDILKINDIIYISYIERNEVSQQEYQMYLETHDCHLAGD